MNDRSLIGASSPVRRARIVYRSTGGPAATSSAASTVAVTTTSSPGLSCPPSADQKSELSRPSPAATSIVGIGRTCANEPCRYRSSIVLCSSNAASV